MPIMSLRLPDEMADTLAHLAKATGRSKSFLAIDALRDYLAREAWQIAEIQKAIEEADAAPAQASITTTQLGELPKNCISCAREHFLRNTSRPDLSWP